MDIKERLRRTGQGRKGNMEKREATYLIALVCGLVIGSSFTAVLFLMMG